MINKLKIGLLVIGLAFFGVAGSVSAVDLTWGADQVVDFSSPDVNATIVSGSTATGLVINAGTLQPTIVTGETFTLSSTETDFTVRPTAAPGDTYTINKTCTAGTAQVVLVGGTSQQFTITPTGTACSNGAGGGGTGGNPAPYTPPGSSATAVSTPVVETVIVDQGCTGANKFSTTTGKACVATTAQTIAGCGAGNMFSTTTGQYCGSGGSTSSAGSSSSSTSSSGYAFGTALVKQGSKGEACKAWQMFFNDKMNAGLVADGICGKKTITSAKAWQTSVGLVADGKLGKMSREQAMMQ